MVRAAALFFVFLFACGDTESTPAEAPEPDATEAPAPAPAPDAAPEKPSMLAASHILIGYEGAMRSKATRTKDEAQALATKVLGEIKGGADFAEKAKEHSEGPTGPRGGDLGSFRPGQMVPAFEKALVDLAVGDVAAEPVETQFGFHVIKRNELPPTYGAQHILIQYKGSQRAAPSITRTKEEAETFAKGLLDKAMGGADFGELAKENSDGPSGPRGGDLGEFPKGAMVPAFEEGMLEVEAGKVVPHLVETPFGFHVILRKQ